MDYRRPRSRSPARTSEPGDEVAACLQRSRSSHHLLVQLDVLDHDHTVGAVRQHATGQDPTTVPGRSSRQRFPAADSPSTRSGLPESTHEGVTVHALAEMPAGRGRNELLARTRPTLWARATRSMPGPDVLEDQGGGLLGVNERVGGGPHYS